MSGPSGLLGLVDEIDGQMDKINALIQRSSPDDPALAEGHGGDLQSLSRHITRAAASCEELDEAIRAYLRGL